MGCACTMCQLTNLFLCYLWIHTILYELVYNCYNWNLQWTKIVAFLTFIPLCRKYWVKLDMFLQTQRNTLLEVLSLPLRMLSIRHHRLVAQKVLLGSFICASIRISRLECSIYAFMLCQLRFNLTMCMHLDISWAASRLCSWINNPKWPVQNIMSKVCQFASICFLFW